MPLDRHIGIGAGTAGLAVLLTFVLGELAIAGPASEIPEPRAPHENREPAEAAAYQTPAPESPWPMFRHDLRHTGYTPYTGPAAPAVSWTFPADDGIVSSPTIGVDGTIYFGAGWNFLGAVDHKLYALNPDGTLKWSYLAGDGFFSSAALGPDSTIFISCLDGSLYAFRDMGTCAEELWRTNLDPGFSFLLSSPAVGPDGTVYVGSPDFGFYAVDPGDGSVKWSFATEHGVESSPAIGPDGTIYFGSYDQHLYALTDDGDEAVLKWKFPTGGGRLTVRPPSTVMV